MFDLNIFPPLEDLALALLLPPLLLFDTFLALASSVDFATFAIGSFKVFDLALFAFPDLANKGGAVVVVVSAVVVVAAVTMVVVEAGVVASVVVGGGIGPAAGQKLGEGSSLPAFGSLAQN